MNITGGTVNEVGINSTSVTTVNNGIGVKFNISHRVEMVNVSVFGFAKYGVEYSGGTFYGVFNNCLFQYNGQYGFWSDESNTTTLLACHFHYNGIGLRPNDFLLLGCIFQGNASHAISLEVNLNLHMIGCYFEVNNLCDQAVGADVFADSAVSVNVHCQDSEFHGTYDSNDFATNNFRGRFATLMFSGCNKFPTMATYYNVFGITTCKIYDRSAPPLCRSATSRFIDQSTSTTLYICPPCPDGDRQVTAATSATVALAPSSQSLELSAASAQNVDTITALNSTQGRVLIVNLTDSDVTLKDGSGNLRLAGDFTGGAGGNDMILLWKNGTLWREISRSVN